MNPDALTEREREIVASLLDGGRVATVASALFVSEHTVRNHLKSIFSKLGVHSQAEVVAAARKSPELAGRSPVLDLDERVSGLQTERSKLLAELRRISQDDPGIGGLKRAVRAALPLDPQRRAVWRQRFDAWNEASNDERLRRDAEDRRREFRAVLGLFVDGEGRGPLRPGLSPHEFSQTLSTLLIGAAMRLVRDEDPASEQRELAILDVYIEESCGKSG